MLLLIDLFCAEWCMCTVLHQGTESFPLNIFFKNHISSSEKNEDSYICQDSNSKPSHTVSIKALYCVKHQRLSAYRCLSVSVGEDAMDLHFFFVHLVDIHPQVLAHWIWRPVCFWCVVVVICVLLQEKKKKCIPAWLFMAHFNIGHIGLNGVSWEVVLGAWLLCCDIIKLQRGSFYEYKYCTFLSGLSICCFSCITTESWPTSYTKKIWKSHLIQCGTFTSAKSGVVIQRKVI